MAPHFWRLVEEVERHIIGAIDGKHVPCKAPSIPIPQNNNNNNNDHNNNMDKTQNKQHRVLILQQQGFFGVILCLF